MVNPSPGSVPSKFETDVLVNGAQEGSFEQSDDADYQVNADADASPSGEVSLFKRIGREFDAAFASGSKTEVAIGSDSDNESAEIGHNIVNNTGGTLSGSAELQDGNGNTLGSKTDDFESGHADEINSGKISPETNVYFVNNYDGRVDLRWVDVRLYVEVSTSLVVNGVTQS